MYVIEDERHAESFGKFETRDEAMNELRRLASIPWNMAPNRAPCTGWRTCGRTFELIDLDAAVPDQTQPIPLLEISSRGVNWLS